MFLIRPTELNGMTGSSNSTKSIVYDEKLSNPF